jgi:hypothetical protein
MRRCAAVRRRHEVTTSDNGPLDSDTSQGLNAMVPVVVERAETTPPDGTGVVTLIERSVLLLLVVGYWRNMHHRNL